MRILDTDRPLRPRLTLGSIMVLTLIAFFVVPQLRPGGWAQSEKTSSEKDPQSGAPSDVASQGAKRAGRSQSRGEVGSKPHNLENRLGRLENDVRQLRKALQDLAAAHRSAGSSTPQGTAELFVPVERMDITIPNRQGETVVVSPMENLSGSGPAGIIAHLIPNGSQVKKGDLLVEFDSENPREYLNTATLNREITRAEMLQASARYDVQQTHNDAARAEDQLQVDLAKLELQAYKEATFPLELKKLEAKGKLKTENLLLAETNIN